MTTLNINIPDDLKARLQARASECGFDRIESYVESLIQDATEYQEVEDADLEDLLLQRLEKDATIELTPTFVTQFKQQVADRRLGGK